MNEFNECFREVFSAAGDIIVKSSDVLQFCSKLCLEHKGTASHYEGGFIRASLELRECKAFPTQVPTMKSQKDQ